MTSDTNKQEKYNSNGTRKSNEPNIEVSHMLASSNNDLNRHHKIVTHIITIVFNHIKK